MYHVAHLFARKVRQRSLVVLLLFVFLSTYWLIRHSRPSPTLFNNLHSDQPESPTINRHRNHVHPSDHRTHMQLTASQELAAVSSFIASLPQNVIPSFVDPMLPIDPELVLDFDTYGPRAIDELSNMVEEVWRTNPVFLYCKFYSPASRELKAILNTLRLNPAPTIIDVDVRDDANVLQPLLHRLTATKDLPILLIGGKIVGSMSDILSFHKDGQLQQRIAQAGAVINGAQRRKRKS